jgi:UDP-N-acetylmuramoylalanine--D-glutamate ligase
MELKGKRVMVLGLARTGCAVARFLADRGAEVLVSDCKSEADLGGEIAALGGLPARYFLGGAEPAWLAGVDLLVPSPGVPGENSLLQEAQRRGIEILSEIELAYRFLRTPLIAITGTNGKSTTTALVGEMLKASGFTTFVGGNIGTPLIGFAGGDPSTRATVPGRGPSLRVVLSERSESKGDWQWGVAEISSFQLEWVEEFRPKVAALLNLSEDHLDRYPDFRAYCRAKERIFAAQQPGDVAVLNRDDSLVWAAKERIRSQVISFGWSPVEEGVCAGKGEIVWRGGGNEERYSLARVKIEGVHNVENLMAATAAAKAAGAPADAIQRAIDGFPGLEHRLEFVREKNGVRYFNDSKGTNVGAVAKSLASFSVPVLLLAGGVDKGGDYRILEGEIKRTVKKLILFGAAKEKIRAALGDFTDTVVVDNLAAAIDEARRSGRPGDVVLLSPACSSFDMFRDYTDRGKQFKELVKSL